MTTSAQLRALTAKEFKSLGLAKVGSSWVLEVDDLYWVVGLAPIAHARFAGFEVGVQFKAEGELPEKPEPYRFRATPFFTSGLNYSRLA